MIYLVGTPEYTMHYNLNSKLADLTRDEHFESNMNQTTWNQEKKVTHRQPVKFTLAWSFQKQICELIIIL